MAKFDAQERQASGEPVPEDVQWLLASLVATSAAAGEIVGIYDAAGLPKPSLSELGPEYQITAQKADNPHGLSRHLSRRRPWP
jgi:type I restriction enzyme, R subunit